MLRNWLQHYLGITELHHSTTQVRKRTIHIECAIDSLRQQNSAILSGQGRIIAKLDPMFGQSEFSKSRRLESDKMAEEICKRLDAEAKVRAAQDKS